MAGARTAAAHAERRPDAREAARQYIRRGWCVIPVPAASKNPNRPGWQNERHAEADIERVFAPGGNVGLLTGAPSGGLLDTDLDTLEAIAAAPYFLPATDLRHGRPSKPSSHYWHGVADASDFGIDKYFDPTRKASGGKACCLVELRGAGHQTVVPPSLHDEGELITWEADGEPGQVTLAELRAAVAKIASCALLAWRWPEGARHDAALALAGLLLRGGMLQPDAEHFVEAVARVAGDAEWRDRVRTVRDTADAIAAGDRATGGPRLAGLLADGDAAVAKVRDWLVLGGDAESAPADGARVLTLAEFLAVEFAVREQIIAPIFPRQGLGMIHAWRGLGKTYLALSIALATAAGTALLKWRVTRPWKVLFVDGEMPGALLQERLAKLVRAMPAGLDPAFFRIVTPDVQPRGIPDLGTEPGQRWLDSIVDDADLLMLDNLSSLVRTGSENADELWLPMATWLLRHRAAGRAAWMVHHDGKGDRQRGISRREDLLDTVLQLRKPADYQESDGARFIVSYPKHRNFHGNDAEPFETRLVEDASGGLVWTVTDVDDALTRQVADMLSEGCTVSKIVKALNIGRATVDRHKRKAIEMGIYDE
jgi:hypothetical protein